MAPARSADPPLTIQTAPSYALPATEPKAKGRPRRNVGILKKISGLIAELGPLGAALYAFDRTLDRTRLGVRVFFYDFMVQPVPDSPVLPSRLGRSMEVREISREDPALSAMPVPRSVLDFRFSQPIVCLGAFKADRLVGYIWLCLGPYEEDEVRCRFVPRPEGEACWDFDVFVFPEYRLGLGFGRVWDDANSFLRDRGVRFTCSRISRFNVQSRKVHERMGAKIIGSAVYLKSRRFQLMLSNLPPYLHLSLSPSKRPVIDLEATDR